MDATTTLSTALCRQLEYYFSRQNLASDAYLVHQMDEQNFIPIAIFMDFAKIKELTQSMQDVIDAMKMSSNCVVSPDDTKVKPNMKSERTTIILREIPSDTPESVVRGWVEGHGTIVSLRSDVGDTWFVSMSTEAEAMDTLLNLRKNTFNGVTIKARIKCESTLRSILAKARALPTEKPATPAYASEYYPNPMYGAVPGYTPGYPTVGYNYPPNDGRFAQPRRGNRNRYGNQGAPGKEHRRNGGGRKNKDKRQSKSDKKARQPLLNNANFPPLLANSEKAVGGASAPARSYAHDDITDIIKEMSPEQCKLANGKMDFSAHATVLTPNAHPDLLKNQRTYSIDQAREAMRQGRPIRSDSVGSVDYESMLYGEEYTKQARAQRNSKPARPADNNAEFRTPTTSRERSDCEQSVPSLKLEPQQEPHPKKGGYAAALLSAPTSTPSPARPPGQATVASRDDKRSQRRSKTNSPVKSSNNVSSEPAKGSPWAAKRSFVDVLKTENDATPAGEEKVEEDA